MTAIPFPPGSRATGPESRPDGRADGDVPGHSPLARPGGPDRFAGRHRKERQERAASAVFLAQR